MDIKEFDDAHRRQEVAKIQNAMKIENVRKNLVEYCGYALQYVPNEFKSKELCETAVNISGSSLKYVPEELKIDDICQKAVQNDSSALEFVPLHLISMENMYLGGLGFSPTR